MISKPMRRADLLAHLKCDKKQLSAKIQEAKKAGTRFQRLQTNPDGTRITVFHSIPQQESLL